jgi:ribulose bisphosphate carboxylase small subunit
MTARARSLGHETTWFYLAGFCLRPGYGADLDLWRMTELWRVFHMGMSFPKEKSAQVQWWIMWRRVAGGLNSEQQNELLDRLDKFLQRKGDVPAELIRLVGSLERIDLKRKEQLTKTWLKRAADPKTKYRDDYLWALGRMGARVPMYAEPNFVLPPEVVSKWLNKLNNDIWSGPVNPYFSAFCTQVFRLCGDRSLDLDEAIRIDVANRLRLAGVDNDQLLPLTEHVPIEDSYRLSLFGESIPAGIKLVSLDS